MVRQVCFGSLLFVFVGLGVVQSAAQTPYDPFDPWATSPAAIGDCMDFTGSTESCPEIDPVWCPAFCQWVPAQNPYFSGWHCYSVVHEEYVNAQHQPVSDSWDGLQWPDVGQTGYEVVDLRDVYCQVDADCICEWDVSVMRCVVDLESENGDPISVPILDINLFCENGVYE